MRPSTRTMTYGAAKRREPATKASGTATAMKKATAVAPRVASSTRWCVVSAAFNAQVNCVQPHHTSQKTSTVCSTDAPFRPWCSTPTTWVTENTKTRSKNSSTNVTFWSCGETMLPELIAPPDYSYSSAGSVADSSVRNPAI